MAYLNKTAKLYSVDLTSNIDGVAGYIEDVNGSIGGVSYDCDNGDYGYIVFDWIANYTASFQNRNVRFEFKQFHYVNSIQTWVLKKPNLFQGGNISSVDDSGFVDSNGVVVDYATAHEDDLTKPIAGTDPIEYEQKLKDGYKTEYQFWFDSIGAMIIGAAQQSVIARLV